jgi:asparagine synthase (glutamine-hydrolysing)
MSGQAGIFQFDGGPIDPALPARLQASLAEYGPDGCGGYEARGLVMVHRALHATPEDRLERQPYVSARGHVMTWDGRLDNRDDLRLQLRRDVAADVNDVVTDVALAMVAYERWGLDAFARLAGDWSLAVYDAAQRAVVLASDYMGVRPLYYWRTDRTLAWSSSLAALVELSGLGSDLDPQYVLGQLVGLPEPDLTPYRGVVSLSPAHALVQQATGEWSKTRFWRCGLGRIDYAQHSQYVEHFRHVFTRAVRARLRAAGPVWCEVSGGLDSSSVACVAHALTAGGAAVPLRFVTHTIDSAPESDERRFAEEVERHCGVEAHYLRIDDYDRFERGRSLMPINRSTLFLEVAARMAAEGAHVVLSGRVGDGTMGNFPGDEGNLAGLLTGGPLREFLVQAHAWSRVSHDPIYIVIARSLAWFLPARRRIARAQQRFLSKSASQTSAVALAPAFLLTDAFAARHSLRLPAAVDAALHDGAPRNPAIVKGLHEYALLRRLQSCWTTPQTLWSYPLADRELVEFVTAIPFDALCPPGQPRALQKEALADALPSRIHRRFSKGYAPPYLMRALRPMASDFSARLRQLHVVERGYVDGARLGSQLDRLTSGALTSVGNLLSICAVELWLDALAAQTNRSDRIPLRPIAVA